MTVPSLSLGVHDRYGPAIRDRIVEKLQEPSADRAYHLLTPAQLRALARTESPDAPVLSFYLQLGPERRRGGAWHSFFNSLATATLKSVGDRREQRALGDELDRIEEAMNEELPELGRGIVFFVCRPIGLWSQIAVSVPLPDHLHLSGRPYVRPLVRTRDCCRRSTAGSSSARSGRSRRCSRSTDSGCPGCTRSPRRAIAVISARRNRSGVRPACWPRPPGWCWSSSRAVIF
jgi:hypothetical protein